ncbi:MAG: type II toxin-antitoxin system VapC family toxin [Acidobacteriota bacterium]
MRFWDSSAIVPLLVPEERSADCTEQLAAEGAMIVWALTPVEVLSAIHRLHRAQALDETTLRGAQQRLASLRTAWSEIHDVGLVGARAERLLAVHPLRAADALQLAAALIACDERPANVPLVCLDARLNDAAAREGFKILPA